MLLSKVDSILVTLAIFASIYTLLEHENKPWFHVADKESLVLDIKYYVETNLNPCIHSIQAICTQRTSGWGKIHYNRKRHLRYLCSLLILRSSDTHLNPGPTQRKVSFPCGVCQKACRWNQKAICCDDCETWYHSRCIHMNNEVFLPYTRPHNTDSFVCFSCGVPNFSTSLFDSVCLDDDISTSQTSLINSGSVRSSDITDTESTTSANISNISSISKESTSDYSNVFAPLCSSPMKKQQNKLRTNNIRIASLNIQSVSSTKKKASFWNFIDAANCDVICGCETWLKPTIYDAEVLPPNSNYSILRKDRPDGYGGCLILTRNDIVSEPVELDTPCDILFTKIECANKQSLLIGSVYRPTNNDEGYTNNLLNAIKTICIRFRNSTILILGDFNLPDINWANNTIKSYQYRKAISEKFLLLEPELDLTQIVDFPTRGASTLDLFFTNRPQLVNRCTSMPGVSDHHAIFIDTNMCAPRQKPTKRTLFMWSKSNIDKLKDKCKTLSDTIISQCESRKDINTIWETFKNGCLSVVKEEVPSRESPQRFSQPWLNRNIRRITRLKRKYFKRAKRTGSPADWSKYKETKRKAQHLCRTTHNSYISGMLQEDKNPKIFWNYIKSKKKDSFGVSPLKKDGITYCNSKKKAELLNDQFTSVFTIEDTNHMPDLPPGHTPTMSPITVTTKGVQKLLTGLNPHKAAGPDKVPNKLLKLGACELAPGLTKLFQLSIDTGTIPEEWKTAIVSPVFKKGNRSSAANYRPISLTSVICKLLEHIISSNIMTHFDTNNILSDSQHGFRKKRSCESQLLNTINDLAKGIDNNQQIDAILLDFSKAFDKVPHHRLLQKLKHYGIRGNIHSWICDFLSSRSQTVVLEGSSSASAPVTSGVPQGSVLGPLLFLAYINDLPSRVRSSVRLFADDCLLYRHVQNKRDAQMLQDDLTSLETWEREWQMSFNPDKCEVTHITTKKRQINTKYLLHGIYLNTTDSAKYLGVNISSNLSWKTHIDCITKKANTTMSFIRRNIRSSPSSAKERAYKTYVRPTLEYASTVWSPHSVNQIQQLEMVQRRAARFVKNDYARTSSVTNMLHDLHWDTLEHRRNIARITMMFRIKNNLVETQPEPLLQPAKTIRGHNQRFSQIRSRTTTYQHSFYPSTILLWNQLPQSSVDQTTLDGFKSTLASITPSN